MVHAAAAAPHADCARAACKGARAATAAARAEAVEAVIEAMTERIDRALALDEMAKLAYLSPYYFNRVFRQVTGLPPRRFQASLRMAAAKRLLLTTNLSVTHICFQVGYRSLGTFVTQFRELVGVSPLALRRLVQQPLPPIRLPSFDASPDGQAVTGVLTAPDDVDRVFFVGLFDYPCPQGTPAACTMLLAPGPFRVKPVPALRRYVAAAAVPASRDARSYLLPDEHTLLVASGPSFTGTSAPRDVGKLHLRPKRSTDPPILLATPELLAAARPARDATG